MNRRPLDPKDLYKIQTVGRAEVSPDGEHIVYVVQRIDENQDKAFTDLYLADVESGRVRRLTSTGKDDNPRFSPDARRIAFTSKRTGKKQIWILDLSGGEAWHLPTREAVASIEWGPDGKNIFYSAKVFSKPQGWVPYPGAPEGDGERLKALAEKEKAEPQDNAVKVITSFRYRIDGTGYLGEKKSHIFLAPVPDYPPLDNLEPQGRQITAGDWNYGSFSVSPDGKYLAVAGYHGDSPELAGKTDLWLYEIATGQESLLYDAPGPTHSPLWSPCGSFLAFIGHDRRCGHSTTSHLWLLNLDKQRPQTQKDAIPITLPLDRPVGAYAGAELSLSGGHKLFWCGKELFFLMGDGGVAGLYKADTAGRVEPVLVDPGRCLSSIHGQGDILIYTASSPDQLEELYVNVGGEERPVSGINAEFSKEIAMGPWEYMPYRSSDGQEVDGWVLYPTDYTEGKKFPLLLMIHGGPHGAYGPSFRFIGQQFAGRGYLVLFTNPRGSETYGQDFACCIDRDWGNKDYADIMAGVDALIARDLVDEDRIFAYGWSYGGYMSCWIATQTDRFKAICAGASVTNLLSDYGTSDITLSDEWEYGGQPWKDARHLLDHSPLAHVENVRTPLLLLHGENDLRCPIGQTEEFYIALKRLGKEVVMVRYPNEFHSLLRPLHQVDRCQRLLSWLK
jgi:dipeptidyl aminopeptidase/acylaminoacyl peptidase